MKRLTVDRLLFSLIALSLVAGAVWLAVVISGAQPSEARSSAEAVEVAASAPVTLNSVRTDALLARPLFNPRRRPPEQEAVKQQELQPLTLVGVVLDSERPAVLLEAASGERSGLLRAGQSFGGWTIVSVQSGQARLQAGDRVIDVPLRTRPRP